MADRPENHPQQNAEADPLLVLAGSGADLWAEEDPDAYVRSLRKDWEHGECAPQSARPTR